MSRLSSQNIFNSTMSCTMHGRLVEEDGLTHQEPCIICNRIVWQPLPLVKGLGTRLGPTFTACSANITRCDRLHFVLQFCEEKYTFKFSYDCFILTIELVSMVTQHTESQFLNNAQGVRHLEYLNGAGAGVTRQVFSVVCVRIYAYGLYLSKFTLPQGKGKLTCLGSKANFNVRCICCTMLHPNTWWA